MQVARILWKYIALISRYPENEDPTNSSYTYPSFGWALILRKLKESVRTPVDARAVKGAGVAAGVLVAGGKDKPFIQSDTLNCRRGISQDN
jgi:hypothetical protein